MKNWFKEIACPIYDSNNKIDYTKLIPKKSIMPGIDKIYIFGSVIESIKKKKSLVEEIDVLYKSCQNYSDFLTVDDNIINKKIAKKTCEKLGYNYEAVKVSKIINKYQNSFINHWILTDDNKLIHWGPISETKEEYDCLKKEAKKYASGYINIFKKGFKECEGLDKENWYYLYKRYINNFFEDIPGGWYQLSDRNIESFIGNKIEI